MTDKFIKADEQLFNEVKELLQSALDSFPSIVQNDITVSSVQLIDFWDNYDNTIFKLDNWMVKIKQHIRKCNRIRN